MATKKLKKYSENLIKTLFTKEIGVTKDDGKYFPKNELVIELVEYSGEYEDKDKNAVPYSGEKIKIINYTLTLEAGKTVRKKKIVKGAYGEYITDDKKETFMTVEQYNAFANYILDTGLIDFDTIKVDKNLED